MTAEAVTALAGEDAVPTRTLDALTRAHLVERGSGRGRWRLHDLVRVYGVEVVAGNAALREEGEAARERLLVSYWRSADAADARLRWLPGMPEPERFADRAQALAWLDGEREALLAAVQWAREERYAEMAVGLASCLPPYLSWRRYFEDGVSVARAAREAAHRAGDHFREATAWGNLGLALRELGRAEEAVDAHTRARDLFQAVGDRTGEVTAWTNIGNSLQEAGRAKEAVDAHVRARDLHQADGNRSGEARAWFNLGVALLTLGRTREAVDAVARACDLFQVLGDRLGEAKAWHNLGAVALRSAGRVEDAIEACGRALRTYREFEDWYGAGQVLCVLALAHKKIHRPADALACYLQAADAYTHANAPDKAAAARTAAAALLTP